MSLCRKREPAIPAVKPGWIIEALKSMGSRGLFIALFGFGLLVAPNAKSAGTNESAARVFAAMAPHDLKEGFRKTYSQAKEGWSHTLKTGIHTVTKTEGK